MPGLPVDGICHGAHTIIVCGRSCVCACCLLLCYLFQLFLSEGYISFQPLHTAFHLVNERVAFLRGDGEEADIVLVGLEVLPHLVETSLHSCALVVNGLSSTLRSSLDVLLECVHAASLAVGVQQEMNLVEGGMVCVIDAVFLTERHMSDCVELLYELLHALLHILRFLCCDVLELAYYVTLLLEIVTLSVACVSCSGIAALEE